MYMCLCIRLNKIKISLVKSFLVLYSVDIETVY